MKHYFFGCLRETGHNLYPPEKYGGAPDKGQTPWGNEMDSGLAPHVGVQRQGGMAIHHKSGWTLISWWDRTVDTRGNSNSAFMAEGNYRFDEMVNYLEALWPEVHNRQPVELFLELT